MLANKMCASYGECGHTASAHHPTDRRINRQRRSPLRVTGAAAGDRDRWASVGPRVRQGPSLTGNEPARESGRQEIHDRGQVETLGSGYCGECHKPRDSNPSATAASIHRDGREAPVALRTTLGAATFWYASTWIRNYSSRAPGAGMRHSAGIDRASRPRKASMCDAGTAMPVVRATVATRGGHLIKYERSPHAQRKPRALGAGLWATHRTKI